jgi:DNA-binding transcriptional LysR family regulator
MAQMTVDRMQGLGAFVRVVEAGSFTGGAHLVGTTPSAISKSIARLERRLGARLFQRSTRSLALTPEGQAYFERVAPLVHAVEEASETLGAEDELRGALRLSMLAEVGRALLQPITAEFLPRHPALRLDVSVTDRHVDLIREGFDLAIRAGTLPDSDLTAKAVGTLELVLVASPDYLDRAGEPDSLDDLLRCAHVRYRLAGRPFPLRLADGREVALPAGGFDADDGEALRIAAVNGLGITQILKHSVQDDLSVGRLRIILPDLLLAPVPVHALHGFGRLAPRRVRALVSFVSQTLYQQALPFDLARRRAGGQRAHTR